MKKRGNIKFCIGIFFTVFILNFITADCNLRVSLINQDPYPAIPNDYVKVVFQVDGVSSPDCKGASIELVPEFPFSLDTNDYTQTIRYPTHVLWYENYWNVPYKIKVNKDALDGENELKINYWFGSNIIKVTKKFNITIEDSRTDFDIAIQDYSPSSNTLTLSIANIGKRDANAVRVEIPPQSNIEMKGSNKNIIGNIEAADYTSVNFKAVPKNGEVVVKIYYTDGIGIQREVEKSIFFSNNYYQSEQEEKFNGTRPYVYMIIGILGIIVFFFAFRYFTKKRQKVSETDHKKK